MNYPVCGIFLVHSDVFLFFLFFITFIVSVIAPYACPVFSI
jgi:hypothetical protein